MSLTSLNSLCIWFAFVLLCAGWGVAQDDTATDDLPSDSVSAESVDFENGSGVVLATTGVSENRILFGQSAAFEGPAAALGLGMNRGIRAAFEEVNASGGVHGRQLVLVERNDGYEPQQTVLNVRSLIEKAEVFALIGSVGTPTSRAALPIANTAGVPYIAPFTGAGFLRDPDTLSVNLRASYDQETRRIVQYLTNTLKLKRVAVVYQDDTYGQVGLAGIQKAMTEVGRELVGIGAYPRNTRAVKTALLDVSQTSPEAIVIIGAYAPTAEFILWAKKLELDCSYFTISFVGSRALAEALGPQGQGVYVSQVVPTPESRDLLIAWQYREALASYDSSLVPGFVSFEGYIAGRMTIRLLEDAGPDLTRAKFMTAMREMSFEDLNGFELKFGPNDNQGSDQVFLTVIDDDQQYRSVQ